MSGNPRLLATRIAVCLGILGGAVGVPDNALAVVRPSRTVQTELFPQSPPVARAVWFWEGIFSRYPGTIVLVHDTDYPELVVDIIDFKQLAQSRGLGKVDRIDRDRVAQRYIDRYTLAVKRFRESGEDAVRYGAMEQRVQAVYSRNGRAYAELLKGKARFRAQAGLADEFSRAAKRAAEYMPVMERIFREHGVPSDLARLPFVESMFNTAARSKVGATGIWQFMPYTARNYMVINHYIDERNSPFKATGAAAQLLSENYRDLKSWPLAVTAYNHGRGGMNKAVRTVGSADLGDIIERYDAPSFGFASKNFYAEFVAAKNVYSRLYAGQRTGTALAVTPITIDRKISISQLLRFTPLDTETIRAHNPCLSSSAFSTYKFQPLPPNYQILVPDQMARKVRLALDKIKAPLYKARTST